MLGALVLTLNEEVNIRACLESVAWVDDVLVLDSFSTDRTVEIARSMGARVMQHHFTSFADQRNFGLRQGDLRQRWVLHLDADERVTPELRDELLAVAAHGQYQGYRVPMRMMFNGVWLRRAGMYPTYQVRFGTREGLQFKQVGHGQRESLAADRVGTLKNPLIHHAFPKGVADWLERHNRYSNDEAAYTMKVLAGGSLDWRGLIPTGDRTRLRRTLKDLACHLPFRPTLRFLYLYLWRLGLLEGRAGLTYARLMAFYEYMIVLKAREMRRRSNGLPV